MTSAGFAPPWFHKALVLILCVLLFERALIFAQSPSQRPEAAFDVVAIKRSPPPETTPVVEASQTGPDRWTAENADGMTLIAAAFPQYAEPGYIVGGPASALRARFHITAKANGNATAAQMQDMVQHLLRERFGFVHHIEKRPTDVYALVHARSDRQLKSGLTPAAVDCDAWLAARASNPETPPPASRDPRRPACSVRTDASTGVLVLYGGGVTMDLLARWLQGFPKQRLLPVENRTGLDGRFDVTLEFGLQNVGGDPARGSRLEDAVQDQLGLKLNVVREPRDVLVIDRFRLPVTD